MPVPDRATAAVVPMLKDAVLGPVEDGRKETPVVQMAPGARDVVALQGVPAVPGAWMENWLELAPERLSGGKVAVSNPAFAIVKFMVTVAPTLTFPNASAVCDAMNDVATPVPESATAGVAPMLKVAVLAPADVGEKMTAVVHMAPGARDVVALQGF